MTALIITAIVSVTAIIVCYHIIYRRLKRLMEAWYSSLAHYFNKSVIIVSDVQARIDEIEEELKEAADLKKCIDEQTIRNKAEVIGNICNNSELIK